jgi:general secretion pathway protein E
VLRQDPDVIMVGEIRDRETAVMAIQSSLTGHLVFSTLHTNDSASAVARLLDLGIEPYLVSSSVVGVLAQRLVRRLCPDCGKARPCSPEEAAWLGDSSSRLAVVCGCPKCRNSGFKGRLGIFELLLVDDQVRSHIHRQSSSAQIKASAVTAGLCTLRDSGMAKVRAALTTIGEVEKVTTHFPV